MQWIEENEKVNQIAYAEAGEEVEFDDDFPMQSAQVTIGEGVEYTLAAKADEGYKFVKWMKDGEDFSTDAEVKVTLEKDAEMVAVFDVDE